MLGRFVGKLAGQLVGNFLLIIEWFDLRERGRGGNRVKISIFVRS